MDVYMFKKKHIYTYTHVNIYIYIYLQIPMFHLLPLVNDDRWLMVDLFGTGRHMVLSYELTYLHFRILEFPLIYHHLPVKGVNLKMSYINSINQPYISDVY